MKSIAKSLKLSPLNWLAAAFLVTTFFSCDKNDGPDNTTPENKTTGFVMSGTTSSNTALVKYIPELPADGSTITFDGAKDFKSFEPTSVYDNALYMKRPDGASGFSKMVVNANGQVVEAGVIPTIHNGSRLIMIKDSETGLFCDWANHDIISVFNPKTLKVTSTINMAAGPSPGNLANRYESFYFRGDDVFAVSRSTEKDYNVLLVHQANIKTGTYVGSTQRVGDGSTSLRGIEDFGQRSLDDQGNLYIDDAGNYSGGYLPARVSKIPVGSNTIDANYKFEPAKTLNAANVFLPTINKFTTIGNGKAVSIVNTEIPQAVLDIINTAGGVQNLTSTQIQQVFGILFSSPSAKWCILDLNTQTVTPITGIPQVGIWFGGTVFTHQGNVYLPVSTTQENVYYRLNASAATAVKAFTITGATLNGMFNIANNN
ncbi:hypothetical protein [Niabella aquatica]